MLNKIDNDLKSSNANLPKKIKVYSDSGKKRFVLVSENKVVEIRKGLKNISDEEFLNKVYEKFLDKNYKMVERKIKSQQLLTFILSDFS